MREDHKIFRKKFGVVVKMIVLCITNRVAAAQKELEELSDLVKLKPTANIKCIKQNSEKQQEQPKQQIRKGRNRCSNRSGSLSRYWSCRRAKPAQGHQFYSPFYQPMPLYQMTPQPFYLW